MSKKPTKAATVQWTVPMTLEFRVNATVEASTEEEARIKALACELEDDGVASGELINWAVKGPLRKEA